MMARVRGVMAVPIRRASILQVSGSMSTKTGLPPSSTITSAVAAKVKGRCDHLVAGLQVQRHQCNQQRLGAAGDW